MGLVCHNHWFFAWEMLWHNYMANNKHRAKSKGVLQEVFHVYLNKFENAVAHLFLVILDNNWFPWVSLISRNTQSSRKYILIFIFWLRTVSEEE